MLRKNFYLEVKQAFSLFKILNKLPLRPSRHPARDDRHPRQSLMVRRIHHMGASEKGRAGLSIKAALSHLSDGVRVKFKII